ncbi:MAG: outer membrane beta-barrel protein, partial [Burkholderiaceae bacterium]|nr:outer membrane beta-barrel protein [Burkholderiaceae bacterium]
MRLAVVFAMLGCAATAASAQVIADRGDLLEKAYFAFNLGQSRYAWRNPPPGGNKKICGAGQIECDNDPIGGKLTIGYQITRHLGVELLAYSMGDAKQTVDDGGGTLLTQRIRIEGYGLVGVASVPLGPARLAARAGVAASTATRKDEAGGVSVRGHKTRANPLFGAGASFAVWRGLTVHLDWDHARATTQANEKL